MSDDICNIPDEPDDFICNLNNLSYYIGKVALEKTDSRGPTFKKTNIKTDNGYPVYNLSYVPPTSGGYIGSMGGEIKQISQAILSMANVFDVNQTFSCIKCNNDENPRFIYDAQWSKLITDGIMSEGCNKINQGDNLYSKCKEGFESSNKKYKKEIFNLYLLGFGTLIVFLSYKLLLKKN